MKAVYKKYLNRVTGTVIFLEDETVESLGEVANSLLKRLDEVLYFYTDGKYMEIPVPKGAKVEIIEVKDGSLAEGIEEKPEPEERQTNEEVEVKAKTNNKNKKKNEG